MGKAGAWREPLVSQQIAVGTALKELRAKSGLSIRALARKSGLAANTLSLIQNDKISPSVATLQALAIALEVPVTAFFESGLAKSRIAHIKAGRRMVAEFIHGTLEDLGAGLPHRTIEPFLVTVKPNANSGTQPIVHTGYEFVYCLQGRIVYIIEDQTYLLEEGDSLLFEAHLPHRWQNVEAVAARTILVLCSGDAREEATERHFSMAVTPTTLPGS
jgi:transcriptional regulator with XRE-family HTH domain